MLRLAPVLKTAATLVILLSGAWGALFLWFRLPGGHGISAGVAVLWSLAALAALFGLYTGRWIGVAAYGLLFIGLAGWFWSIRPQGEARS